MRGYRFRFLMFFLFLILFSVNSVDAAKFGAIGYQTLHRASLDKSKKHPMIVLLHGCTMDREMMVEITQFTKIAKKNDVYLLALDQSTDYNPVRCWNWHLERNQKRDSGELLEIMKNILYVVEEESVDPERIYVVGLAAGGVMAANLVSVYPELFAGVAIHSGLPYGAMQIPSPGAGSQPSPLEYGLTMTRISRVLNTSSPQPVVSGLPHDSRDFNGSVIIIHGMDDAIHHPIHVERMQQAFFGSNEPFSDQQIENDFGNYRLKVFSNERDPARVVVEVPELGNRWSGGKGGIPGIGFGALPSHGDLGDPNTMDATSLIWSLWQ